MDTISWGLGVVAGVCGGITTGWLMLLENSIRNERHREYEVLREILRELETAKQAIDDTLVEDAKPCLTRAFCAAHALRTRRHHALRAQLLTMLAPIRSGLRSDPPTALEAVENLAQLEQAVVCAMDRAGGNFIHLVSFMATLEDILYVRRKDS